MPPAPTPLSRLVKLVNEAAHLVDSNHAAFHLLQEAQQLGQGFDPYIEHHSSDLYLYQQGQTKYALTSGMCSGNYEATVLQQIALMHKSKRVLEIGVFTGTATLALALIPSVEQIIGLDIEPFLETFNRPYWQQAGVSLKIQTFMSEPASKSLNQLYENKIEPFDLIFIDADKPNYQNYVEQILNLGLLSQDGIIVADNTLLKGFPWSGGDNATLLASEAKRYDGTFNKSVDEATRGIDAFNKFCIGQELFSTMLPIRDGITIIRRA
ncbi:hypothetical protein OIO90_003482 [Microbotryomycetes sp. JL221]|nr:hypothetical protein OIO90_003482 [Microbotryomycetes sp. JL221]